jgi:hypothetical protein
MFNNILLRPTLFQVSEGHLQEHVESIFCDLDGCAKLVGLNMTIVETSGNLAAVRVPADSTMYLRGYECGYAGKCIRGKHSTNQ